jgi:hypothetical protein
MSETVMLKALHQELAHEHEPAAPAPEVNAMMQATNAVSALVNQRNQLEYENGLQRQRIAELEAEHAQYRVTAEAGIRSLQDQVEEVTAQRDFFRAEADGYRDANAAIERILARRKADAAKDYPVRDKMLRSTAALSPKDDGAPAPAFLTKPLNIEGPQDTRVVRMRGSPSR